MGNTFESRASDYLVQPKSCPECSREPSALVRFVCGSGCAWPTCDTSEQMCIRIQQTRERQPLPKGLHTYWEGWIPINQDQMGCVVRLFQSWETVELFYLLNESIKDLIVICLPAVFVLSSNITFVATHNLSFFKALGTETWLWCLEIEIHQNDINSILLPPTYLLFILHLTRTSEWLRNNIRVHRLRVYIWDISGSR